MSRLVLSPLSPLSPLLLLLLLSLLLQACAVEGVGGEGEGEEGEGEGEGEEGEGEGEGDADAEVVCADAQGVCYVVSVSDADGDWDDVVTVAAAAVGDSDAVISIGLADEVLVRRPDSASVVIDARLRADAATTLRIRGAVGDDVFTIERPIRLVAQPPTLTVTSPVSDLSLVVAPGVVRYDVAADAIDPFGASFIVNIDGVAHVGGAVELGVRDFPTDVDNEFVAVDDFGHEVVEHRVVHVTNETGRAALAQQQGMPFWFVGAATPIDDDSELRVLGKDVYRRTGDELVRVAETDFGGAVLTADAVFARGVDGGVFRAGSRDGVTTTLVAHSPEGRPASPVLLDDGRVWVVTIDAAGAERALRFRLDGTPDGDVLLASNPGVNTAPPFAPQQLSPGRALFMTQRGPTVVDTATATVVWQTSLSAALENTFPVVLDDDLLVFDARSPFSGSRWVGLDPATGAERFTQIPDGFAAVHHLLGERLVQTSAGLRRFEDDGSFGDVVVSGDFFFNVLGTLGDRIVLEGQTADFFHDVRQVRLDGTVVQTDRFRSVQPVLADDDGVLLLTVADGATDTTLTRLGVDGATAQQAFPLGTQLGFAGAVLDDDLLILLLRGFSGAPSAVVALDAESWALRFQSRLRGSPSGLFRKRPDAVSVLLVDDSDAQHAALVDLLR